MVDNPAKRGKPDRSRVSVSQVHELRHWSGKLGCSQLELVLAHHLAITQGKGRFVSPGRVEVILDSAREHLKSVRRAH